MTTDITELAQSLKAAAEKAIGTQRAAPDSAMSNWLKRWRKSWNGTSAGRGARSKMANLATT